MLRESQYAVEGYVFGRDLPINVAAVGFEEAETALGDLELPGQDGIAFGRDHKRGPLITFELNVLHRDPDEAKREYAQLASRWDAAALRRTPRLVTTLTMRQPGTRQVVVYGRPRSLERTSSNVLLKAGRIDAVATFQAADHLVYDDTGTEDGGARELELTLVAAAGDGIVWPLTWPVTWGHQGVRRDAVISRGDAPTWPVITIRGPVSQPSVEIVGTGRQLRLDTTLAYDQTVTIDTRPWARTILRDDGASLAGVARGAALSDFLLPVGQTVIAYRGTDTTGQSRATVAWRDAYHAP